ncbi:MAG: OadG family protein [Treponema sp.]|nr:OadG family protein [Spirochaetia bacterium]MDY4902597.1 OadG family protein [Treponema sp.]
MTIAQMLEQSGILTLLGLCVVFSFLIILILAMNLLRIFVKAFHLEKKSAEKGTPTSTSAPASSAASNADNGAVIAAIAAAIHEKESV